MPERRREPESPLCARPVRVDEVERQREPVVTLPLERYEELVRAEMELREKVRSAEEKLVDYERRYNALANLLEGRMYLAAHGSDASRTHKIMASAEISVGALMQSREARFDLLRAAGETLAEAVLMKIAKAEDDGRGGPRPAHTYRIPEKDYELPEEVP